MRVKRVLIALVAMLACVAVTLGVVSGTFAAVGRKGLYATGLLASNGPSTLPSESASANRTTPSPSASRTPAATPSDPVDLPDPVLPAADPGKVPGAAEVSALVEKVKVKGMGSGYSGAVLDVGSGRTLFSHNRKKAYIPASTMKLLTSAAALSVLGPEHTFTTKVVAGSSGRIILVGGGDPYLEGKPDKNFPQRASMTALAKATATALRKQRANKIELGYDDSLFSGPRWNPTWPNGYGDVVTPVTALWVDEGRTDGTGPRVSDPSKKAAEVFAGALRKRGIKVSTISDQKAKTSAKTLASVSSMPLDRIVERLLMVSDNDAAEVVFRQVAAGAKKKASFSSSAAAVESRLRKLGVWGPGDEVHDGSGLSRETHVSADTMAKVLRLAADDKHPELRGVITGLPVAGVEGSLRTRYGDEEGLAGRGLVRGKTGTLRKVQSLAGFVRAKDGSMMVYAFLVNNPKNDFAARVWLEHVSAALSTCGCR